MIKVKGLGQNLPIEKFGVPELTKKPIAIGIVIAIAYCDKYRDSYKFIAINQFNRNTYRHKKYSFLSQ